MCHLDATDRNEKKKQFRFYAETKTDRTYRRQMNIAVSFDYEECGCTLAVKDSSIRVYGMRSGLKYTIILPILQNIRGF